MRRLLLTLTVAVATAGCSAPQTEEPPSSTAPELRVLPHSETIRPKPVKVDPRVPTHLRVWKYDASIVPIAPSGSTLTPPSDPKILGWWGAWAGAREGTTLLTGHTVSTGGGTFDDLENIPLGVIANVDRVKYKVVRVEVISKESFAERAPSLLAQDGRPRLVLVTCESYDPSTGHYDDNVVVVGLPYVSP